MNGAMAKTSDAFPVIMCGGSGTRLWPASRPSRPKQFIGLTGQDSLFAQTARRMIGISGFCQLVVVAGKAHEDWLVRELAPFQQKATVLLEPEGRDSAAAIAAAVALIERQNPQGLAIIVASDHHIPDVQAFQGDIALACQAAREGGIVTLGIEPRAPSTAYGYIRPDFDEGLVGPVGAFAEKPEEGVAAKYISQGYLWNSGNFIARVDVLADAFEMHAPKILSAARKALAEGGDSRSPITLGETFRQAPKISFDYAIMENHSQRMVVRSKIDWSDLGAWDAVHAVAPKDEQGNSALGKARMLDSRQCHVRNVTEQLVVLEGLDHINLVVEEDVIFASRLERAQSVKAVVEYLKSENLPQIDAPANDPVLEDILARWVRWHDTAALPLWWSQGFDRERNIWREHLDPQTGMPNNDPVRARVQGRQSYVFARAGRKGWPGPWQEALEAGLKAIEDSYAGPDGLMRTLVDQNGEIADDAVLLYDQTFTLLALAEAHGLAGSTEERALRCFKTIQSRFARNDGGKGYREAGAHPYQSNAHMHLLEAALAWSEQSSDETYLKIARSIGELALEHFIDADGKFLREFFQSDWSPAAGELGRVVEPGHQFEWAWLLARLAQAIGDKRYILAAKNLFSCGLKGIDAARGVAVDQLDEALQPISSGARLWPQTEWLKAAALLAETSQGAERNFYDKQLAKAAFAVDRYLTTPVCGLWFDKMKEDGTFVAEMAPASSLYHIVGAIDALQNWARQREVH